MTTVIHQPDFLPYLGFFQRLLLADLWVVLDNVQFLRGSKRWHNRDKIKTAHGEQWLTVGVQKSPQDVPINQVLLAPTDWRQRSLNLIAESYRKAPHFDEIYPHVEDLYAFDCHKLVDFNMHSIDMLAKLLDIDIERKLSSSLALSGKANELLVDILEKVGSKRYLSGVGAKAYFDPAPFERSGIEVVWQEFEHPQYPQMHGEFIPYLSTIDLLFNCGALKAREVLRASVKTKDADK